MIVTETRIESNPTMANANPFATSFPGAPQVGAQASPQGFGAAPGGFPAAASAFGPPPVAANPAAVFGGQPAGVPVAPSAPAGGFGLGLPSLGDVSEGGGRLPFVPEGVHLLVFAENLIKTRKGHTVNINFVIESTDNPLFQPGARVVASQKINPDVDKRGPSLGAVLSPVRALAGCANEAEFKARPDANGLFQAALAGQPLPFAGRKVWARGTRGEQMQDKNGAPVPGKFWVTVEWAPAA